jgi:large subunit ribosomal protein L15e
MARSMYSHIRDAWKDPESTYVHDLRWHRLQEWRREASVQRIDKPTRLDRARSLGYKAKQGIVMARAGIRRGSARKPRYIRGRRSKRMGMSKITRGKSLQRIAEERAARRFPNLQVLNSYWVGEDGKHKWYEIIMVDPAHPVIKNDPKLNWLCQPNQRGRVFRGKTSAGTKGRGQRKRGKGTEKTRPSIRSRSNLGK